jgi:hypothetical protein
MPYRNSPAGAEAAGEHLRHVQRAAAVGIKRLPAYAFVRTLPCPRPARPRLRASTPPIAVTILFRGLQGA